MAIGTLTIAGNLGLIEGGVYGPEWAGALLILRTDQVPVSSSSLFPDITEAIFNGYLRHLLQWSAAAWDSVILQAYVDDVVKGVWRGPGDSSGQVVNGWALIQPGGYSGGSGGSAGPILLGGGPLDAPSRLVELYDQLTLNIEVSLVGQAFSEQVS